MKLMLNAVKEIIKYLIIEKSSKKRIVTKNLDKKEEN